ncbi:MAG: amidohydrolase family protein, partial [Alphaproteobacteria bacterium]|nr:amidohydrolase family protein [Alphaproteobacteria bacterium]
MSETLFRNVQIVDGTGAAPFAGDVLVKGERIAQVARDGEAIEAPDATTVDGAGMTLMPGLIDAHAHIS